MKKLLTINGNSWHLYINKPIADLMGINKDEYLVDIKIDKKILYVSKSMKNFSKSSKLTKKLIKRGSGFGLNFSIPILELLEISPEKDFLDVSLQENSLIIKKFRK